MHAHRAFAVVAASALLVGGGAVSGLAHAQGRVTGQEPPSAGAAAAGPAGASYFQHQDPTLTFEVDRPRSHRARVVIASLVGGAVLMGGLGVLFTLDSKSKADEVSSKPGNNTGRVYTAELDDTRRAGLRSRTWAVTSFAVGGGLLVGALVAYVVSDPGRETIHVNGTSTPVPATHGATPPPNPGPSARVHLLLAPTRGGALLGGAWSF